MYDERELTVEQIGKVLGVSRTSIYRALGQSSAPAPPAASAQAASATAGAAEPVAVQEAAVAAAAAPVTSAPARQGQPAGRSRGRSRCFVVQADPDDPEHGPVAVLSGHTSQKAVAAALAKASRASARSLPGVGERVLLRVRAVEQISSRLVRESQAGRGVVQPGPPP